ncbi:MAG: hypothetical protein JW873_07075 [Candidatus Saganbacteria bacterium]|nr:hypothetical protein [Candidatus Saganbacteria bacterium]
MSGNELMVRPKPITLRTLRVAAYNARLAASGIATLTSAEIYFGPQKNGAAAPGRKLPRLSSSEVDALMTNILGGEGTNRARPPVRQRFLWIEPLGPGKSGHSISVIERPTSRQLREIFMMAWKFAELIDKGARG